MKRIAVKLVVFLLLGAVVNVGVAWGCAKWSPTRGGKDEYIGFGITGSIEYVAHVRPNGEVLVEYWIGKTRAGWPLRCAVWNSGPNLKPRVRPLFPGFLINTLLYGVILLTVWSTPFVTRRLIRKRRSWCVRCGYDLSHADHELCPECGGGGA